MPRNSSGTYTLPAGNPVVANTLIETNWANPTMSDIGQALTESLDRYGRGGMLAPFRIADGLVTAPGLAFASESTTGIYRTSAGTWNLAILGVNVFGATSTGVNIVPPTAFTGSVTFNAPPLRAADPATGDELTRKSYVDNLVTSSGTAFVKKIGDTMSGPLTITAAPNQFNLRSTGAGVSTIVDIGRASNDAFMGVSGGANQIITGDVAGDFAIRNNTGAIRFGIGASGYMTINAANGVTVGGSLNAVGNIINNAALSGIRAGSSPGGLPAVQWTNASGVVNSKLWDFYASPTELIGRVIDDTFTTDNPWIRVTRSGMTIPNITFPVGRVGIGVLAPAGIGLDVGTGYIRVLNDQGYRFVNAAQTRGGNVLADDTGTRITSDAWAVRLATGGTDRLFVNAGGLVGIGRTPLAGQLEIAGGVYAFGSEGLRIVNDGGYVSWYNAAQTSRIAYLQALSAGVGIWNIESGTGSFNLNIAGSTYVTVTTGGVYNGAASEPLRLTRVNEFSISANAASFPGGRIRFGRVAAVVGTGGTITFSAPFATLYACVSNIEGAQGGGWIYRYHSVNVNGFTYTWDQYNTAGAGAACFVTYYAIGI